METIELNYKKPAYNNFSTRWNILDRTQDKLNSAAHGQPLGLLNWNDPRRWYDGKIKYN